VKLQTLEQFQRTCGLSDRVLLWLLSHGKIAVVLEPQIMIDVDSVENQEIIRALISSASTIDLPTEPLVQERLAAVVSEFMDSVVDEAIAIAIIKSRCQ